MSLRLAILASGNGSNAQAMFDAVERGALDADIRLVLSNRPGARVLERAAARSLPCRCLDHTQFPDRAAYDRALAEAVREAGADTVALAGYMRLLSPDFLAAFAREYGYDLRYFQPGSEDRRTELAKNQQVDLISGCEVGDCYDHTAGEPLILPAFLEAVAETKRELHAEVDPLQGQVEAGFGRMTARMTEAQRAQFQRLLALAADACLEREE